MEHSFKYELRHNTVFSTESRAKFADHLYEPYKIRGNHEEVMKNSPKYAYQDIRNGHATQKGYDEKGFYAIFQPKEDEYDKIKAFALIKDKIKKLSELAFLQRKLKKTRIPYSELLEIEGEIDILFLEVFEKDTLPLEQNTTQTTTKPYPFYCEIGALFAQDLIKKDGFYFYYNNKKYNSILGLSKQIQQDLNTTKSVRQYINDTLNEEGQKNFLNSKNMLKKTFDYCNSNNIDVSKKLTDKYTLLNK